MNIMMSWWLRLNGESPGLLERETLSLGQFPDVSKADISSIFQGSDNPPELISLSVQVFKKSEIFSSTSTLDYKRTTFLRNVGKQNVISEYLHPYRNLYVHCIYISSPYRAVNTPSRL